MQHTWVKSVGAGGILVMMTIAELFGTVGLASAAEPPEEQLDCRVYETKTHGIIIGFKAGNLLFSVGPEVTFSRQTGIAWERAVQGLIARYVELCTRYNTGLVTKAEYESRLRQIDGLYREAQELEKRLTEETRTRARAASDELDRTLSERGGEARTGDTPAIPAAESLDDLNRRIEQLEPIGRPLKPKPPCPPPDMLGAPGRSC